MPVEFPNLQGVTLESDEPSGRKWPLAAVQVRAFWPYWMSGNGESRHWIRVVGNPRLEASPLPVKADLGLDLV